MDSKQITRGNGFYFTVVFCLLATLQLIGCGSTIEIIRRKIITQNPMQYTFHFDLPHVRQAIETALGMGNYYGMSLTFKEKLKLLQYSISGKSRERDSILLLNENREDFYLDNDSKPFTKSSVYSKDSLPLDYSAEFHLHLNQINDSLTSVQVITRKSFVTWQRAVKSGDSTELVTVTRTVQPTSIEEYDILLRIGDALLERDMPDLITPTDINPTVDE